MRVNREEKAIDIERRDINYILPAYIRAYLFYNNNEDPEKIVFPMFRSVPHPHKPGVEVPIEYIPDDSPVAVEIAKDGDNIPETTPEAEAEADKKEEEYNTMKARIAELEDEVAEAKGEPEYATPPDIGGNDAPSSKDVSPAKAAFAKQIAEELATGTEATGNEYAKPEPAIAEVSENQPTPERLAAAKAPDTVLPPGTPSDYGGSRDKRDQRRVAKDIAPEKDIKEEEEIEIGSITEIKEPGKEE